MQGLELWHKTKPTSCEHFVLCQSNSKSNQIKSPSEFICHFPPHILFGKDLGEPHNPKGSENSREQQTTLKESHAQEARRTVLLSVWDRALHEPREAQVQQS